MNNLIEMIKVVYIVGASRSGSTLLGKILGCDAHTVNAGELVHAPRAYSNPVEYCSCGERVMKCSFWTKVQEEWSNRTIYNDFSEFRDTQLLFGRLRNLPYLMLSRLFNTQKYRQYLLAEKSIYQSIAHVSGKGIIVDSSKSPVRAFALSKIPSVNFQVVHLVRDGRGVIWSQKKAYSKNPEMGIQINLKSIPTWRTACSWVLANTFSEILADRVLKQDFIRIRYEDLVENPELILKKINTFTGIDYRSANKHIQEERELSLGHVVAGNRMRMKSKLQLKPDYDWKRFLPKKDEKIFWLIAGLLAARYGYKWRSKK